MKLYSFDVEYDQTIWVPDPEEPGTNKFGGKRRGTRTLNVVAESRERAEAEVVNNKNFYEHQNPIVKSVKEIDVDVVVTIHRWPR